MWFSTNEGLTRFDGYSFKTYPFQHLDEGQIYSDHISAMDIDDQGTFWISRHHHPLENFDPVTGGSTLYPSKSSNLPNDIIVEIHCENDLVWLGHAGETNSRGGGLSSLNKLSGEIKNYQFEPIMKTLTTCHQVNCW